MAQTSLRRPDGLVQSPASTHVAVVPPGVTTVYIGGQNAVDGDGALVGGDDVSAQTRQVMKNLHVALAAAGARAQGLVMMTVLFVDDVDLAAAYPVAAAELAEATGIHDLPVSHVHLRTSRATPRPSLLFLCLLHYDV